MRALSKEILGKMGIYLEEGTGLIYQARTDRRICMKVKVELKPIRTYNSTADGSLRPHCCFKVKVNSACYTYLDCGRVIYALYVGPIASNEVIEYRNGDTIDYTIDNMEKVTVSESLRRRFGRPIKDENN